MKFILKLLLVGTLLVAASCVKKKNCDCNQTGTWEYLQESYDLTSDCGKQEITAHFYPDHFSEIDSLNNYQMFTGNIPKEYRKSTLIRVNICSEPYCKEGHFVYPGANILKCIEKEE